MKKHLKLLTIFITFLLLIITFRSLAFAGTSFRIHTVQSGESLWKISVKYGVTVSEIMEASGITNIDIYPGQQLKIPTDEPDTESNQIYTVQSGDVIWKIAIKYNVSTLDLLNANNLTETSTIYIGQKLLIPLVPSNTSPPLQEASTKPYVTYSTHTVQRGETGWSISIKHGIPMMELLSVNNLTTSSVLNIGQKLTIPVHHVPVLPTPGARFGEYLDWWSAAQYVFPIKAVAKVTDFATGKSYNVIRNYGAFHADCEPLTAKDAAIMYDIWGQTWNWVPRAAIVEVNGRRIAAAVTNMPHSIQEIKDNNFNGHFDIHFLNSTRHSDGLVSEQYQKQIRISAGLK